MTLKFGVNPASSAKLGCPVEYNDYLASHTDCCADHHGSASIIESEGAVEIFKRSEEKRKLCYVSYLGDDDTSSFTEVVEAQPYGEVKIPKKDKCVGHVQKRVGSRLRKLKDKTKNKLEDGKSLGGKGRLTNNAIDKLQSALEMAIRQNVGDLYVMKKNV